MNVPLRRPAGAGGQAYGLALMRVLVGVFFLFTAFRKLGWLISSDDLINRFSGYLRTASPWNRWYLDQLVPGLPIFARLVVTKPEDEQRCRTMGITDFKKIYSSQELACGKDILFAATGVTDGSFLKGVRFFGAGIRTSSLVMQTNPHRVRFIDSIQVYPGPAVKIRF